ncbi:MAG TPA: ester cyclase [Thermoanaerobaculia bacterium]|nr:ester cyclase [Thermoanaerobaculia bacterium]
MAPSPASRIQAANAALLVEGDLDAVGEYFAPEYVAHFTGEDLTGGPAAIRKFLGQLRRAFADLEVEVEILVESRDRVAWQRTIRATHRASYQGFPATDRPIVWRDMVTSRFRDGLIVEDWALSDLAEQLLRARKS